MTIWAIPAPPHWDDLYLDFWSKVSPELKFKQKLYKAYLEKKDFLGFQNL